MGLRKRLKSEWNSVYQAELAGLQERHEHGRRWEGKLTREAHHYNLTTTEPLGIKNGTDLGSERAWLWWTI